MRLARLPAALAAFCSLASLTTAQDQPPPDKLTLKSGSILTGKLDYISADEVKIATDELDDQVVEWGDIANLESADFLIGTDDDARYDAAILGVDGSNLRVRTEEGERTLPIERLEEVIGGRSGVDWKGAISVGLFRSWGNTERRSANVNANATRRTADDRWIGDFKWNYEDVKQPTGVYQLNDRRTSGSIRYDHFIFGDDLFVYGRAFAESDFNANVDLRYTLDAGLGYQVVDMDDVGYSIQLGIGYIDTDFAETPGQPSDDSDSITGVASHNFNWEIVDDLEFLHNAQLTQSLEEKTELIIKADSRLRWTMIDDLFAEIQHLWDYNGAPPANTQRIDNRVFINLGYSF